MGIKKATIRALVNNLDRSGTNLMFSILRAMDSDNVYYTSLLAKNLKHTWANTYNAVNRLASLGLIKTAEYIGAYRAKYDNVKGLVLTRKGYVVRSKIFQKKKEQEK